MISVLANFRRSKTAVFTILEALNFDFWKNFTVDILKVLKNSTFRVAQMVKISNVWAYKMAKIDFT